MNAGSLLEPPFHSIGFAAGTGGGDAAVAAGALKGDGYQCYCLGAVRPHRLGRRPRRSPVVAAMFVWLSLSGIAEGAPPAPQVSAEAPPQTASEPRQASGSGLARLSIEELSRISVISTARRQELVSEAAAAVSIITADTIRRAGITTLPEALRLVAGVSVGRDGNTWAISARGFQASTTNKMVVLVDGRSVYSPLFSGVFWDAVDLVLADVDRIEVIRGAGGALWGANAINGVINVITKNASQTQGTLVEVSGGSHAGIVNARYGGTLGSAGHYRVYAKHRLLQSMPYSSGVEADEDIQSTQIGMRLDLGVDTRTAFMMRGDVYDGRFGLINSPDGDASGVDIIGRLRHTFTSGAQLEFQAYYDTTYRRVPVQYAERRHTGDLQLQYGVSLGERQHLVAGVGYMLTHDRVTPTAVLSFDPDSRTSPLVNVYAQDSLVLVPGRLQAIFGVKLEHNDFTGFEYQPTARLRFTPRPGHTLWGAVSRAVRMPTRIDTDLRFTAGTPFVVLTGNPDFQSETVISTEVGYRRRFLPWISASATAFFNVYDALRSQEPTPPIGVPIVIGNKHSGRVRGFEVVAQVEPLRRWQVNVNYSRLAERFSFDADSRDPTGGMSEHNDPPHQLRLRSFTDLTDRWSFDATLRWVAALPRPAVPSYTELTLRVARMLGHGFEVDVVGENLLHDRHLQFVNLGPSHDVPRSVFARLTWRR